MPRAKQLFHSELCKMTKEGPILIFIKSAPAPSRWKGKPPYCPFVINGEERWYNCENSMIEQQLTNLSGKKVMLQAEGRDEEAVLTIPVTSASAMRLPPQQSETNDDGDLGPQQPPQQQAPQPPPQQQQAPVQQPPQPHYQQPAPQQYQQNTAPARQSEDAIYTKSVIECKKFIGRRINAMRLCVMAVEHLQAVRNTLNMPPLTVDQAQAIASSLFISGDRERKLDALPYKELDNYL